MLAGADTLRRPNNLLWLDNEDFSGAASLGAAFGGTYGEGVNSTFTAGPQAGVKYYADRNTFIYAGTEYQFAFEDSDEIDDAFDDGSFYHTIGIGFNF